MPNGSRRVLIAGVSTRAMADSAARAGYDVTAIDAFGDLDHHPAVQALSTSRDFGVAYSAAAAARIAKGLPADAVAYQSNFENRPRAVGTLAGLRALWGNSPAVLRRVRDPQRLATVLEASGCAAAAVATAPSMASGEWLIKPRASGGGHGVQRWRPDVAIPEDSYVQRYVDGSAGSIAFVAANGSAVPLCLTRQLVGDDAFGARDFKYCGSILGAIDDTQFVHARELLASATSLARVAAQEFGLVGVNGIDFIADNGVPVAIEVNPRYSASMELAERAFGVSVFGVHADACAAGELPSFDVTRAAMTTPSFGKAIVFARHDIVCGDTRPWLDDATVRDVPHPGERIPAGRPVCTIFTQAPNARACYDALARRAELVYEILDRWRDSAA